MKMTTSFTRGPRYPAPDVARGFMLLLIAIANVPVWLIAASDYSNVVISPPLLHGADAVWVLVRTLLVDQRSIPLFAMLFGFGLMTMINRRIESGTQEYLKALPGADQGAVPHPVQEAWAREQATVDARRLVRRRGWWMILFGAVHGLLFFGDIIGAYGLAAVVFAGWLARKHWGRALAVCIGIIVIICVVMLAQGWWIAVGMEQYAAQTGRDVSEFSTGTGFRLSWPLINIIMWPIGTMLSSVVSVVVPAMFIGARLADTDLLVHPERHRGLLIAVGLVGLGLAALGAYPHARYVIGHAPAVVVGPMLAQITGLLGACGWLALLSLYAGGPRPDGRLTGLRWLASAVGRRSMTAYLCQTFVFGAVLGVIPWALGVEVSISPFVAGLIAVATWGATVVLCAVLERQGRPGPFETLLRTAVARSASPRPVAPAMPMPQAPSGQA
ncbi:DUF418 domain-containing protein [Actinomyces slackii]|uniref:Predicted membrane protein n=1 Tax=Actinomyces slackii TaxID=52774 RepID=A0A448K9R8_9ACTO|nr:DUF418 domain-containing protein [Actinomyces slackii]VEG73620.1 Predicted membrane protein [Actinomyces slackii]